MANAFLAYGHRARAPYLSQDTIPSLEAGLLKAQQFGNDWYVNSAAISGGDGSTPASAKQTLAAALAVAVSGDRIFIAPGHAETISAAGGITWSQSGITVIGLGIGATRPTFTWSATASTFIISGANNILSNIRCVVSIDEVVLGFSITGDGNVLDRVDFVETTSKQLISFATITGDDCILQNSVHIQTAVAAATQVWITLTGADRFKLLANTFVLALKDVATGAVVSVVTTACTNVLFKANDIKMTGFSANLLSVFLSLNTTTGLVAYNNIYADVAVNTTMNDMPGCASFQNFCTNALDKSGILDPVADT